MMRRTELRRSSSLTRSWLPRSQTGMRRGPVKPKRPKRAVVKARDAVYALVDARAGGRCEICGDPAPAGRREHSHRSHAGMGGSPASLRASNLLVSCVGPIGCNRMLSDNASFAASGRVYGWLIGRGADPTTTPVLVNDRWVLLDDEGHYVEVQT